MRYDVGMAKEEGFAGLPTGLGPQTAGVMTGAHLHSAVPQVEPEDYQEFRLPKSCSGQRWVKSGRPDDDLTFGLTEMTTQKQLRAAKLMGARMDFGAMQLEQLMQCIYVIGGKLTRGNRQEIEKWLDDIGSKNNDIVTRCHSEMTSATESESQEVLEAGKWKSG